jgi:deoxyribodipyrimidine photo-lyase
MTHIPPSRVRAVNDAHIDPDGDYVLYRMTAFRRTQWNFSLQRSVAHARELRKPLVVFEALRSGYRWASDRLHQFVIQGMADNERRLEKKPVLYFP